MKKVGCLLFATGALLLVAVLPSEATNGRQFHPRFQQGHHFQHHHSGARVAHGHHFQHHHHFGTRVFVGVGPVWPWWGPAYYPYPYPVYTSPVVIQQSPPVYIQREAPEQQFWYYCQNPQGYYPYVPQCPAGWLKVAPTPPGPAN